jgi:hypothetical protein
VAAALPGAVNERVASPNEARVAGHEGWKEQYKPLALARAVSGGDAGACLMRA